jgi:signal transduction histidine kinase
MATAALPCLVYGPDLRLISANAAARRCLRALDWTVRPRVQLSSAVVQPDPLPPGPLPRSAFRTFVLDDGTRRTVLANYRRSGDRIEVRFEPLESAFAFTEQILDPILVTDQVGILAHANRAAAEVLHLPLEAFLGRPALFLGGSLGMDPDEVQSMLEAALTGRGILDDFVLSTGQGRPRRFVIRSSPWRFCGEVCGAIWLTAETTYSEQRDLELVSATWYRMSATYQHELRNPLQTIQAAVDLGRMRDDGRNARVFEALDQSVKLMSDFVAEQLHPGSGGPVPRCALSCIVEEEVDRARIWHTTRGLAIRHERLAEEPPVRAHRVAMTRVFANLFRNIAQAQPCAAVTIRYCLDGGRLVCTVDDDGPGFPPEILHPGWLNERDPRKHLGLSIVAAAIEACGGDVHWQNRPEGGARVTIRLPLASGGAEPASGAEEEAAAARHPERPASAARAGRPRGTGGRLDEV